MCDLSSASLDQLRYWTPEALKSFLRVRKKSTEGSFDQLVARAFAAIESKAPVDQDAENTERLLLAEYKEKLCQDGDIYPDPFTIHDGWEEEETGRFLWPSVHYADIGNYLQQTAPGLINLQNRLLNEYKEGKAYRYYTCERVRQVEYHPVRQRSPFCFLRAMVYPSMTTKKPYIAWVMVSKRTGDNPGGRIQTAYCSCPAGLLGSCNHVAGLLFRVEGAVKSGATSRTPTEETCQWIIPHGPVGRRPQPVQESLLSKDKYSKKQSKETQAANLRLKRKFVPYSQRMAAQLTNVERVRGELESVIAAELPDCIFVQTRRKMPPSSPQLKVPERETITKDLKTLGQKCHTVSDLKACIKLTSEEIAEVERQTRGQATSEEWLTHRLGRLTSSRFYAIHTRMKHLDAPRPLEAESLQTFAKTFIQKRSTPMVAAIKHGIALESTAKAAVKMMLEEEHTHCVVTESGLIVSAENPFLAASPDLLVHCDCCGDTLVEIKCPYAIRSTKPTVNNVPYLTLDKDQEVTLKTRHMYYGQIQGQLAITGRALCYLFVFTEHGHLLIVIKQDQEFWNSMLPRLEAFWTRHVAPLLIQGEASDPATRSTSLPDVSAITHLAPTTSSTSTPTMSTTALKTSSQRKSRGRKSAAAPPQPASRPTSSATVPAGLATGSTSTDTAAIAPTKRTSKGKKHVAPLLARMYLCGACGMAIADEPRKVGESSIKCSRCPLWYHIHCAGISEWASSGETEPWNCPKCADSDSD